ncbi:MAG: dehydrogenase, partial [Planctomycetota bacterium]
LNPEKWRRQTALRILADRRDRSVLPELTRLLAEREDQGALEAFWAIYQIGGLDETIHRKALSHANPYVRLWAVRLAGDEGRLGSEVAALAERETHPEVRAQLACTAKRLPGEEGLAVVRGLLKRAEDTGDPRLPLLVWWAVESKCGTHREEVLALFDRSAPGALLERVMRRFAQAGTQADWAACEALLSKAPDASSRAALIRGFELAFQGRAVGTLPEGLARAIAEAGGGSIELRVRAGDASALEKALATLEDRRAPAEARRRVARLFGEIRVPGAVAQLLRIASAEEEAAALRSAALAALRLYDESSIAEKVAALLPRLSGEPRDAALSLLAARPAGAVKLLEAARSGAIDLRLFTPDVVERLRLHADERVQELLATLRPPGAPTTEAMAFRQTG